MEAGLHPHSERFVPTISMFYGIVVLMFYRDNERHHLPHIHVRYQGKNASVAIDDRRLLDGDFPPKQLKLVQAGVDRDPQGRACRRLGTGDSGRRAISDRAAAVGGMHNAAGCGEGRGGRGSHAAPRVRERRMASIRREVPRGQAPVRSVEERWAVCHDEGRLRYCRMARKHRHCARNALRPLDADREVIAGNRK